MTTIFQQFCRALIGVLMLALLGACASTPVPQWEEAKGYGVMPPQRKEGEARLLARASAIREARQTLLSYVAMDPVDGVTVERLMLMSPHFRSRIYALIGNSHVEEIPDQPKGIVMVKVKVDRNEISRLAKRYGPKDVAPSTAAGVPVPPTPSEATPEKVEPLPAPKAVQANPAPVVAPPPVATP